MNAGAPISERRRRSEGRLDHAPRASDRASFDPAFGVRYSIFVDTEEEFDWAKPRSRDSNAVSHIRHLPEFQSLADSHGIRPCYLIDYPIADSPESTDVIGAMHSDGRCTVGTQLHAWVSPPFEEEVTTFNSFAGNLPMELELQKLTLLTERIQRAIGERPIVHRAGRYGVGPNSAALLEALGYKADVSVRPHCDYSAEGGPSFLKFDSRPFWAGPEGNLLELPLGVAFTGQLRHFGRVLYAWGNRRNKLLGAMARSGMLSRVALTPEDMPEADVKDAIQAMLDDGIRYLSFSFHSPSLAPGHTPYVRNSAELSDFYRWWDKILSFLASKGVAPADTHETIAAARRAKG